MRGAVEKGKGAFKYAGQEDVRLLQRMAAQRAPEEEDASREINSPVE